MLNKDNDSCKKYRLWYMKIINKAKLEKRVRGYSYYECHHILPKSLFPLWVSRKSNLVLLTAREHFVCHLMLTRIFPSYKMKLAYSRLALDGKRKINSREYERAKRFLIETEKNATWKCKKVICLNTMEIFDSINQAEEKYNKSKSRKRYIGQACKNHSYAFKLNGMPLFWEYYNERIDYKSLFEQRLKDYKLYQANLKEIKSKNAKAQHSRKSSSSIHKTVKIKTSRKLNKPKIGTKDKPLCISTVSQLANIKGKKYIQFNCEICNKQVVVEFRKERIHMFKRLLCKDCKTKETCLEKYGTEYAHQNKEVIDKMKKTNLDVYGCECVFQNETIKNKIKNTNLEKYGKPNFTQTDDYVQRSKETYLSKYGVDNFTKTEEYKEKQKATNLRKFGVEWASQNKEIQNKITNTFIDKYGSANRCHIQRYVYDNQTFDSSWELIFWIYNKDVGNNIIREPKNFKYVFNGKKHLYFPDFEVNGQLYEIKGDQFFKKDGTMCNPFNHELDALFEAKHQCGLKNNVTFLREADLKVQVNYVVSKYGKNFIESLKIT